MEFAPIGWVPEALLAASIKGVDPELRLIKVFLDSASGLGSWDRLALLLLVVLFRWH